MKPLTDQQQRVLSFVENYSQDNGYPPALREIGSAIGLTNVNAVRGHLNALEKKGYITKDPDKARSICVVHSPSRYSRIKRKLHKILQTDKGVIHRVVYGIAWTTLQKQSLLTTEIQEHLTEAFQKEAVEHGWEIISSTIEPNYVALVVIVWPNHSAEQTVRRLQNALKNRSPGKLPDGDLWEKGYIVTTDLELLDELLNKILPKTEINQN